MTGRTAAIAVLVVVGVLGVGALALLVRRLARLLARAERELRRTRQARSATDQQLAKAFTNIVRTQRDQQSALLALARQTDAVTAAIRDQARRTVDSVRAAGYEDVAQIEAMVQVLRLADVREALPRTRMFPASPDALLVLVDLVRRRRPRLHLDLGSGVSTVVVASAARAIGLDLRVVALEHDADYAEATRRLVDAHGLSAMVDVRHAPLRPLPDDPDRRWYDPAALADLTGIDLCFVDGPPGDTNPLARIPAITMLGGRLAPGAHVLIDDAARADEQALAEEWSRRPEVVETLTPVTEKGMVVLRIGAADPPTS